MSSPRGYSDSSDDENPKKRRKVVSDKFEIEERLESLISRVGDKSTSSSLESNLGGLANVLEADLGNHKKKIFKIILNCAIDLPQRLSVYSTLVGLLNAANYSAGGDFIDMLITLFKDALQENNYFTAVHLMRFLSDLVNCKVIMPSSMLDFYNIFLDAAFEESTPQTRADWLVYAVLSCLPWSGKELSEKKEVELDRLLSSIEGYLERRNRDFIPALLVWNDEEQEAKDKLDSLWIQIQDMRQSNWRDKMMRRLYLAFDSVFRDAHALQHTIPAITIPPYDKRFSPLPEIPFRIFDYSDIIEDAPRLPKEHSIDRFIVEETIQATIHTNCLERKVCADHLLNLEFKEKIPLNYLIIEAIFGQLFQMPDSPSIHLMYGVLLIELCKLQPSSMPQVLAQATMILYNKLDTMNTSCIQRFAEWFSYHLSNFQFKWMWEDWMDCINLDLESPKSKFVQETLKKSLRLSYYQRVVDIVPASFAELLPPEPQPINKFEDAEGEVNGSEHVEKIVEAVRSKCSAEEMNSHLSQLSVKGGNSTKIDIFLTSLLHLASKTPSHSFAAVAKYHSTLKMLTEGQNKQETQQFQVCILNALQNLWANKPQMILILVDKFLKTQLVGCSAVISWIFSPQMERVITSFHVHEILESTVKKLRLQLEKELQLETKSSKNKNKDDDEDDDDEEDNSMDQGPETSVNLERCRRELEGLELLILEKLISAMMEHISMSEAQGISYKSYKFQYLNDRLKEFLLKSRSARILSELKSKYYETNLHLSILKVFEMVQPLLL